MSKCGYDKPSFAPNAWTTSLTGKDIIRIAFQDFDQDDNRRYTHASVVLTPRQTGDLIKSLQECLDKREEILKD